MSKEKGDFKHIRFVNSENTFVCDIPQVENIWYSGASQSLKSGGNTIITFYVQLKSGEVKTFENKDFYMLTLEVDKYLDSLTSPSTGSH